MNLVFESRGQSVVENISRCWTQRIFRWTRGSARSNVADFPHLQFVSVMSSGLLENFLRDSYGSRKEGCPNMNYCGDFPEVHIKLSGFSLKDFGKEAVLI